MLVELCLGGPLDSDFQRFLKRLNETFGFAVSLWVIRRGANVLNTVVSNKILKLFANERRPVVRDDLVW